MSTAISMLGARAKFQAAMHGYAARAVVESGVVTIALFDDEGRMARCQTGILSLSLVGGGGARAVDAIVASLASRLESDGATPNEELMRLVRGNTAEDAKRPSSEDVAGGLGDLKDSKNEDEGRDPGGLSEPGTDVASG